MDEPPLHGSLPQVLADGLDRLSSALRVGARRSAERQNLNLAQSSILRVLQAHRSGLRVRDLARHVGVRQPTVTESLNALVRKGLVLKQPDPTDARAVLVRATEGRLQETEPGVAESLLAELSLEEQAALLRTVIKLIRGLQLRGAIPTQRLCVTCRHFRPNRHPGTVAPHHCAFVDAPFGDGQLRLDCLEHAPTSAADETDLWARFVQRPEEAAA